MTEYAEKMYMHHASNLETCRGIFYSSITLRFSELARTLSEKKHHNEISELSQRKKQSNIHVLTI